MLAAALMKEAHSFAWLELNRRSETETGEAEPRKICNPACPASRIAVLSEE